MPFWHSLRTLCMNTASACLKSLRFSLKSLSNKPMSCLCLCASIFLSCLSLSYSLIFTFFLWVHRWLWKQMETWVCCHMACSGCLSWHVLALAATSSQLTLVSIDFSLPSYNASPMHNCLTACEKETSAWGTIWSADFSDPVNFLTDRRLSVCHPCSEMCSLRCLPRGVWLIHSLEWFEVGYKYTCMVLTPEESISLFCVVSSQVWEISALCCVQEVPLLAQKNLSVFSIYHALTSTQSLWKRMMNKWEKATKA